MIGRQLNGPRGVWLWDRKGGESSGGVCMVKRMDRMVLWKVAACLQTGQQIRGITVKDTVVWAMS